MGTMRVSDRWAGVVRSPGTGAMDGCELPGGSWESNLGPLEEQPTLLTAEPFLQPQEQSSKVIC